jgi:hypothetical protein
LKTDTIGKVSGRVRRRSTDTNVHVFVLSGNHGHFPTYVVT